MSLIDAVKRVAQLLKLKKRLSERDDPVSNAAESAVDDGIESLVRGLLDDAISGDEVPDEGEWGSD